MKKFLTFLLLCGGLFAQTIPPGAGVYSLTPGSGGGGGGSGTVTSVSVTTANGVSGSVATATTTPAITLTLGAIVPTTVNGNTFTTGSYTLTGTAGKTLTFSNSLILAGTDGSTLNIGTGGTLGTAAFVTLGANVGTWLATPSSSNLATAMTDKTGTGVLVFGTSPSFTTSILTGSTTFALLNATATTVNAFGAATALNIGATATGIGVTSSSTTNLNLPASTTGVSTLRLAHGSAPTSPVNGDLWSTTSGFFGRVNGSTVGPFGAGASLTSTLVGYGDGSNALTGEAAFSYNATTNIVTAGGVSLGAGNETSSIGALVDSDGVTPLNNIVETTAAGTAYTLTTSYAALDFGTTDPVIVLPNKGTYTIQAWVQATLVSATTTTQSVSFKMRRTNNTAADLGDISSAPLPVATVGTEIGPSCVMISTKYTTTNTNDSLTIQGLLSASLGAGTCTITAAHITAIRAY